MYEITISSSANAVCFVQPKAYSTHIFMAELIRPDGQALYLELQRHQ